MFRYLWYRHPIAKAERHRLGPAWRWKLAGEWLGEEFPSGFDQFDRYVRWVWRYRRQVVFGPDYGAVNEEFWDLFQGAEAIQESRSVREECMILVLGQCLPGDIANWYGFENDDVVRIWEGTFFDLRDAYQATDWIFAHVIEPERRAGNLKFVAKLNLAMRGGPEVAKVLLRMDSVPPADETERHRFDELQAAMNAWIAVNQPFRSEKDMQQMLRYKQRLDDIDRQVAATRASESESEQCFRERLAEFRLDVGNHFPPWPPPATETAQAVVNTPPDESAAQG